MPLFNKSTPAEKPASDAIRAGSHSSQEMGSAILRAFAQMQSHGVERLVVNAAPGVNEKSKPGGWVEIRYFQYYPEATLQKCEKDLAQKREPHQIIALVAENASVMKRGDISIEVIDRVPVHLMASNPKQIQNFPEILMGTKGVFEFAEMNEAQKGMTIGEFESAVENGIAEYKQILQGLLEKSGVFDAIENMANNGRKVVFDKAKDVMAQIRANVYS